MKIDIGEPKPWLTPNFIIFKTVDKSVSIKDVDAEVLDIMCSNFRKEVFEKAGKIDPTIRS